MIRALLHIKLWLVKIISKMLYTKFSSASVDMNNNTFTSLLNIYHEVRGRGENSKFTLETRDNEETVTLTASRPASSQAAWISEREGQKMPPSPLYSVPPPNMWRSPGRPLGSTWTPSSPPISVKKRSFLATTSVAVKGANPGKKTGWR